MNTTLCCTPLSYSLAYSRPSEPQPRNILAAMLSRGARVAARLVDAMARPLPIEGAEALRLAEFIARQHSIGRL